VIAGVGWLLPGAHYQDTEVLVPEGGRKQRKKRFPGGNSGYA